MKLKGTKFIEEMKTRGIDVLVFREWNVKASFRCHCYAIFQRNPSYMKRSECPGCQSYRPLEEWLTAFLYGRKLFNCPQHRIYFNVIGEKMKYISLDKAVINEEDIYCEDPIAFMEAMEYSHYSTPNNRDDNRSLDNYLTFKFRRSDYYKLMISLKKLVPIIYVNEYQIKDAEYVKCLEEKLNKAVEISKIKSKKKKLKAIINFYEFPAERIIPYQDYNEYYSDFVNTYPMEARELCKNVNEGKPIDWDLYLGLFGMGGGEIVE